MALARGLTARQAGEEFNLNPASIAKIKNRYGFPSLVSEYEFQARDGIARMKDEEINSYMSCMELEGKTDSKDYKYCVDELAKRNK
jgi:hypothetical protein